MHILNVYIIVTYDIIGDLGLLGLGKTIGALR